MSPVGFKPTISAGERPQTYALDRAATGIGKIHDFRPQNKIQRKVKQCQCLQGIEAPKISRKSAHEYDIYSPIGPRSTHLC